MSFFKASSEKLVEQNEPSAAITRSGMYEVLLTGIACEYNANGARSLHLLFDYEGNPSIIFNAIRLENNDLSENFEAVLFHGLCYASGITEVSEPEDMEVVISKKGTKKLLKMLPEFTNINMNITLFVRMEYDRWNGEIKEKKRIVNFYLTDNNNATPSELKNSDAKNYGYKYKKDLLICNQDRYKGDVTEEDVKMYRDSFKSAPTVETKVETKGSETIVNRRFGKK